MQYRFAMPTLVRADVHHRLFLRISEMMLILLAFLGGSLGALLGMEVFRHKTQHWKFKILVPLALVLWIVGICYLLYFRYPIQLL